MSRLRVNRIANRLGDIETTVAEIKSSVDKTAKWYTGSGSPEGNVTAEVGSIYTRTDGSTGSTFYVKETGSGNTGWVAK